MAVTDPGPAACLPLLGLMGSAMARRRTFRIRDWDQFRHYKNRHAPWVKLPISLLDRYEYTQLSDISKSHLIGLCLLACKLNNRLPYDPEWLRERMGSEHKPDLSSLEALEFIEVDASNTLAICVQNASNGVSETLENSPISHEKNCPHQQLVELYHQHCPTLPRVKVLTARRQQFVRQRWREVLDGREPAQALEWFSKFFARVNRSGFLTGQVANGERRAFVADFEWLMRPSNFVKVHEGRYDG